MPHSALPRKGLAPPRRRGASTRCNTYICCNIHARCNTYIRCNQRVPAVAKEFISALQHVYMLQYSCTLQHQCKLQHVYIYTLQPTGARRREGVHRRAATRIYVTIFMHVATFMQAATLLYIRCNQQVPAVAKEFISALLTRDAKQRLGSGPHEMEAIKARHAPYPREYSEYPS